MVDTELQQSSDELGQIRKRSDFQQTLAKIRERQPDASIIVVTAFPSMDSALTSLRSHVFDYLAKPFQPDELKKVVMRCLESRGLLRLSEEALREQIGAAIRERRKSLYSP